MYLIGVDEAGRGPLAGPVAVGLVMVRKNFNIKKHFPGLKDSKLISEKKREELYETIRLFVRIGKLQFCARYTSPQVIDRLGMTRAVRRAVHRGVRALAPRPRGVFVFLDGLLYAPEEYDQETLIRGDELEPIISLASIVAKVRRDRLMRHVAQKYPKYNFDLHKGYGTRAHYAAITREGLCKIHRRSFCKNVTKALP